MQITGAGTNASRHSGHGNVSAGTCQPERSHSCNGVTSADTAWGVLTPETVQACSHANDADT
eukprot:5134894-Alexandrium_andersonii.AAC.1